MVDESRIAVYNYLYALFNGVVSDNVYSMTEPTETTDSDVSNGFIVTRVGTINDESEFVGETYAKVRCHVIAYVPKRSRGRLDKKKYAEFEDGILEVLRNATESNDNETYYIMPDTMISMDGEEASIKGNQYLTFVKSFVVVIDKPSE